MTDPNANGEVTFEDVTVVSFYAQDQDDAAFENVLEDYRNAESSEAQAALEVQVDALYESRKPTKTFGIKMSREGVKIRHVAGRWVDSSYTVSGGGYSAERAITVWSKGYDLARAGDAPVDTTVTFDVTAHYGFDVTNPSNSKNSTQTVTFAPGETEKLVMFDRIDPDRYASLELTLSNGKSSGTETVHLGFSMDDDPEHTTSEEKAAADALAAAWDPDSYDSEAIRKARQAVSALMYVHRSGEYSTGLYEVQ
ncbi:hypothetical protein ACFV0B_24125 [Streptomyces xanthophaeus]|uniref:hypothetical protein n=1 Tax=Streptomyces xanthophaeus TaxID=67385 RepID=UPI0036CA83BE